jgi:hypothetical protein
MGSRRGTVFRVLGILAILVLILLIAFVSTSDGDETIHAFGQTCLVVHHGWHFHAGCSKS